MIMDRIALVLAIIGGLNWGSIGLFRFDIVAWLSAGRRPRSVAWYTRLLVWLRSGASPCSSESARKTHSRHNGAGTPRRPGKIFWGLRSL